MTEVYIELGSSTVGALIETLGQFPPEAAVLMTGFHGWTDNAVPKFPVAVVAATDHRGPVMIWPDLGTD